MSRRWTKTWLDVVFGMVVMGTVGALIGTILGGSSVPITAGLGVVLGAMVGFLGGRRFLLSILVGTVLGGLLAWLVAEFEQDFVRGWSRCGYGWIFGRADFDVAGYASGAENSGCRMRALKISAAQSTVTKS